MAIDFKSVLTTDHGKNPAGRVFLKTTVPTRSLISKIPVTYIVTHL